MFNISRILVILSCGVGALLSSQGNRLCIAGCEWCIERPMRWPVTFQIKRGFKLKVTIFM